MLKFHLLQDGDYDKSWCSDVFNESDWPIRFIMKLEYIKEQCEDYPTTYHISISAVAIDALGQNELESVSKQYGDDDIWEEMDDEWKHYEIQQYGCSARLFYMDGNNMQKLERTARKEMKSIEMLFGLYMDKYQNALGSTGWDFIKGDITAGIRM